MGGLEADQEDDQEGLRHLSGDSIYHPFDLEGKRHMEYLAYRGVFADVRLDQMAETFSREYSMDPSRVKADFDREVDEETGNG